MRILLASSDLANRTSFSYLLDVVTRSNSKGWQTRMLCSDSLNSSKLLWMVGMITVTSLHVYEGFAGRGLLRYIQWVIVWTTVRV